MMSSTVSRSSGPKLSYAIVMPFAFTWPLLTGMRAEPDSGCVTTGRLETAGDGLLSAVREQPRHVPAPSRAISTKTFRTDVFMCPPEPVQIVFETTEEPGGNASAAECTGRKSE